MFDMDKDDFNSPTETVPGINNARKLMHQFNILYTDINSYILEKYINNTLEKHNIN